MLWNYDLSVATSNKDAHAIFRKLVPRTMVVCKGRTRRRLAHSCSTCPLGKTNQANSDDCKQAEEEDKPCQGSIVNLSSIAAHRTHPDLLGYSISCAALSRSS